MFYSGSDMAKICKKEATRDPNIVLGQCISFRMIMYWPGEETIGVEEGGYDTHDTSEYEDD